MRFPVPDGEEAFIPFFDLVQDEASKQGKVFFLDAGQGRDFFDDDLIGADLSGWLVDMSVADDFESQWRDGWDAIDDLFFDDFVWAVWSRTPKELKISFKAM